MDLDLQQRLDSWSNEMTGHGTVRDKVTYGQFVNSEYLSDSVLDNLFSTGRMVRKICSTFPEQYLKKVFELQITVNGNIDLELSKKIRDRMDALDVRSKYTSGFIWGNVFGGCALFIGADDTDDLEEPLDLSRVSTVDHLNILEKPELSPSTFYNDPTHFKYGKTEKYIVNSYSGNRSGHYNMVIVHESRFIIFPGVEVSNQKRRMLNGWDLSLIQNIYESLRSYGIGMQSLDHMIYDANQGVLKFKDYMNYIARGDYVTVKARLEAMDISRSIVRALVVDADNEDFERQNFSWSGIDKPFQLLMLDLSAASNIPVSILMGREPAGMNATGESDFKAFYDLVISDQQNKVKPRLVQLAYVLCAAENVEPDNIDVQFESLWELSLDKQADIRLKTAQTDKINSELGLVNREEIQKSRFTKEGWNIETYPDLEMRERLEKAELEAAEFQNRLTVVGGGDVQREALNGAQMKSIVEIVALIGAQEGGITENQARGILATSIPGLSEEAIDAMVKK